VKFPGHPLLRFALEDIWSVSYCAASLLCLVKPLDHGGVVHNTVPGSFCILRPVAAASSNVKEACLFWLACCEGETWVCHVRVGGRGGQTRGCSWRILFTTGRTGGTASGGWPTGGIPPGGPRSRAGRGAARAAGLTAPACTTATPWPKPWERCGLSSHF
jgi:hypothetical protein